MKNKKILVVGAGLSGATIANLITSKTNNQVLVIDKRNHIAGNCFDYKDGNGITIHKYGSHIFHTQNKKVWDYVNNFSEFNNYKHKVLADINNEKINLPINFNSIHKLFSKEKAQKYIHELNKHYKEKVTISELLNSQNEFLKEFAQNVYEKIYLNYSIKQWGQNPLNLDNSVLDRIPIYLDNDNNYFKDVFQGIPKQGYSKLIENMLSNEKISIFLNTPFEQIKTLEFDKIFFTGSIDEFFNYKFGILSYRSVSFDFEVHNKGYYQQNSVINYPNKNNYTRIHEFKYYLDEKSNKTTIAKEYPKEFKLNQNERFYPILNNKNIELYNMYKKEAKNQENVYFLGRLGNYKYYNMDDCILKAINLFEQVF